MEEEKETEYLAQEASDIKAYQTETVVGVVFIQKKERKHKRLR